MGKDKFKLLQVGPYPPPMGGWSFHIKVFKGYLKRENIQNEVLNVGASRKDETLDCIDTQGFADYVVKQLKYLTRGYVIYNHVDGCSWKGFVLTITSQLLSLLFFRKAQLSFHAGTNQHCFKKDKIFFKVLAFMAFALCDKIICNSEFVKDKIIEFGKEGSKIFPIPCFSEQYLDFDKSFTDQQLGFIDNHTPVLFTYVFFREEFTIEILIESFEKILREKKNSGMIVVGSTEGSEKIQEMISKLGMANHFIFAGDVPHESFLSLLSASDLYVRTHLNDGVCSSVLESVFLGVPVVAAKNEMRPEEILTYDGGDGADLYDKMQYALDNLPELKQQLKTVHRRDTIREELEVLISP